MQPTCKWHGMRLRSSPPVRSLSMVFNRGLARIGRSTVKLARTGRKQDDDIFVGLSGYWTIARSRHSRRAISAGGDDEQTLSAIRFQDRGQCAERNRVWCSGTPDNMPTIGCSARERSIMQRGWRLDTTFIASARRGCIDRHRANNEGSKNRSDRRPRSGPGDLAETRQKPQVAMLKKLDDLGIPNSTRYPGTKRNDAIEPLSIGGHSSARSSSRTIRGGNVITSIKICDGTSSPPR